MRSVRQFVNHLRFLSHYIFLDPSGIVTLFSSFRPVILQEHLIISSDPPGKLLEGQ